MALGLCWELTVELLVGLSYLAVVGLVLCGGDGAPVDGLLGGGEIAGWRVRGRGSTCIWLSVHDVLGL